MDWLEISVTAGGEAVEAVAELFDHYVPGGAVVETPLDCFEYELPAFPPSDRVVVKGYFPLDSTGGDLRQRMERELWLLQALYPISEPVVRKMAETDWAEAWKQQYHLLRVGRHIVIVPAWESYTPAPDEVVIRLEPGMAFGTGLHPTTRLCLEALEAHLRPGCTVLDVGTGSGILAIAAARLGARSVLALDADPVAVVVAQENVMNNDVVDRVVVQHGSLPGSAPKGWVPGHFTSEGVPALVDAGHFDLVLINILAPVIVGMAPALAARLKPQTELCDDLSRVGPRKSARMQRRGRLIAAGLIESQEEDVMGAFEAQGLHVVARAQEEDWVALVARRR